MTTEQTPLEALEPTEWPATKKAIWDVLMAEQLNDGYIRAFDLCEKLYQAALTEAEALRAILVDVVNRGTDGACLPTATTEFLKSVPIECAAMKAERDALRARVTELEAFAANIADGLKDVPAVHRFSEARKLARNLNSQESK